MRWINFLFLLFPVFLFSANIDQRLKEHILFDPVGPNKIGYIKLEREKPIDRSTLIYVQMALEHFKKEKVCCVLLDFNTPGGELYPTLQIVELLHNIDVEDRIPVIAFIDNWALSAGAILAYSCRYIAVTERSIMGAAEPVYMDSTGKMVAASEKVNSALRAEIATIAHFYNRNILVAQAMVDKDIHLVNRNGELIALEPGEEMQKGDTVLSRRDKLLTLDGPQLMALGVASFEVPITRLKAPTIAERSELEWPASDSLVFQQPFLSTIPNAVLIGFQDWRVSFISFLIHPLVASLLMIGLIVGLYIEVSTPGFGFAGIVALTCLGLVLFSQFAQHIVTWIEVYMLVIGIGLVLIELFLLPAMGILAVIGGILFLLGTGLIFLPSFAGLDWVFVQKEIFYRLFLLSIALLLSFVVLYVFFRFFAKRISLFGRLVSGETQGEVTSWSDLPQRGSIGIVFSTLRPAGKIEIDNKIYDAISQGEFIEKGEKVRVVARQGNTLVVRKNV